MDTFTQLKEVNNKLSKSSIGIGGNYCRQRLDTGPVVHISSISEAEKRLKKLQRNFQHTYQKYIEARSNSWYNYRFYIKTIRSEFRCGSHTANCISNYKYLVKQLQNDLDKLNKGEARPRRICKQGSMQHSYKSLAEEKRILQQIGEKQRQHLENNDLGQEKIAGAKWMRSWEADQFEYYRSRIPKSSSSKAIHDLLRRLKDTKKLRDKTIVNTELVNNSTSDQDILTISSIKMEIKLLEKVITKLEEERGMTKIDNGEEKMKHLEKQCEFICRQMDEENKYIVELKKKT